ncbi:MAG: hypothetical protein RL235_127 [Chlamydiota bacterium]|jgi:hypothetical protein
MAIALSVTAPQTMRFSLDRIYTGWSREDCTLEKVRRCVSSVFAAIITDAERRASSRDPRVLQQGFYGANEYAVLLSDTDSAKARYEYLRDNNCFYHGQPPKGFDRIDCESSLTQKECNGYQLRTGVKPSDGLKNVANTFCLIDCGEAVEFAYYCVLLEAFGEDKFNEYFKADGDNPLQFRTDIYKTPLRHFFDAKLSAPPASIQLGDHVYFANLSAYHVRHRDGDAAGYHAICVEDGATPKFLGFGLDSGGLTEEEVIQVLVKAYNAEPIDRETIYNPTFIACMVEADRRLKIKFGGKVLEGEDTAPRISFQMFREVQYQHPGECGLLPFVASRLSPNKIAEYLS